MERPRRSENARIINGLFIYLRLLSFFFLLSPRFVFSLQKSRTARRFYPERYFMHKQRPTHGARAHTIQSTLPASPRLVRHRRFWRVHATRRDNTTINYDTPHMKFRVPASLFCLSEPRNLWLGFRYNGVCIVTMILPTPSHHKRSFANRPNAPIFWRSPASGRKRYLTM